MRAHVSINVKDVPASVAFYQKIFGVNPQKQTPVYAKFDLLEPSLNFSMQSAGIVSRVAHFGIEVDGVEDVMKWEKKLVSLGLMDMKEEQTDCCYALQDKVWFQDPDGNQWEVFFVHKQLEIPEEKANMQKATSCVPGKACC